jgi:hypothetical protein
MSLCAAGAWAGTIDVTVTDATPTAPVANPTPASYQPRYLSGFGSGDSFTVFFEDRDNASTIGYVSTTTGPTGFPAAVTLTNIADTHFCVKDWPITIGAGACAGNYDYRAWASTGNNPNHTFYVSNDLTNWCQVSSFTISNHWTFTGARGSVYYGFHDVLLLNGTYYAWGESNQGQTMMVRSVNGDDVWEAFDSVGGTQPADGPLQMPESATPSGSFFDLGADRGYGKIQVRGNDSGFYLAVNTAAKPSLWPPALEAAFLDPNNWTWNDDTTGLPTTPILAATAEHDMREGWLVPSGGTSWTIMYDADYGAADGGKALGYTGMTATPPPPLPTVSQWGMASLGLLLLAGLALTLRGVLKKPA